MCLLKIQCVVENLRHAEKDHPCLYKGCPFLMSSTLLHKLWAEAICYAAWLKNWLPTKVLGNTTPYERLYGSKPHLAGLPEWGQWVWVHNPSGSKLDTRATQARWVGYDGESTHAHRIYWQNSNTISIKHNIKFVNMFMDITIQPDETEELLTPPEASQLPAPQQIPLTTPQPTSQCAPGACGKHPQVGVSLLKAKVSKCARECIILASSGLFQAIASGKPTFYFIMLFCALSCFIMLFHAFQ